MESLKLDIFRLLYLIHQNNRNKNNILSIKEFSDNPGKNLKLPDILLFESREDTVKLPFYFPTRRRNMFNVAKNIPLQLMKTFKTDDDVTAYHRYLSTLSTLYEQCILNQSMSDIMNARFAIGNAISQELDIRGEEEEEEVLLFYDYELRKDITLYNLYDMLNMTDELANMSNEELEEIRSIGPDIVVGFSVWIVPHFLLLHLCIIEKLCYLDKAMGEYEVDLVDHRRSK